tara:strand:- start:4561 stop:5214 length:654 start_codon:yes stop_codon:yes gene_type:complete
MNKSEKVKFISKTLNEFYPNPPIPLNHNSIFTLLVAVVLSAQCTDVRVNLVTHKLFKKANNPKKMMGLGVNEIRKIIKPCGLSPQKSKSLYGLSKIIIERFNGKVPESFKDLESLPGVGHKTASVVMSQGFGHYAFPVDTHVHRLAQRWGLTKGNNVKETEKDLKRLFPEKDWNRLHIQIIMYGREFCTARSCYGLSCHLCSKINPNRKKPIKANKP